MKEECCDFFFQKWLTRLIRTESIPILVKVIFSKHMDKKNKKIKFAKISLIQKNMLMMARISWNCRNTNSYSWPWKPTDSGHICVKEENDVSSSKKLGPDIELIITSRLSGFSKYLLLMSFIQDNLFIVSLPNLVKLLFPKPNLNIQFHSFPAVYLMTIWFSPPQQDSTLSRKKDFMSSGVFSSLLRFV